MYQVIKRDGHIADFSLSRISHAITKAFDAPTPRILSTSWPYKSQQTFQEKSKTT